MKRHITLIAAFLAVVACSSNSVPSPSVPAPTATAQASGPSAQIELQITDGPYDGSYRAVAIGACRNEPDQNRFSVKYSDNGAPDGFVALDLVLNDVTTAQDDSSADFSADISVGGANGGVSYSVAPGSGQGDGAALIEMSPTTVTLEVEMDASDQSMIELTVLCDLG